MEYRNILFVKTITLILALTYLLYSECYVGGVMLEVLCWRCYVGGVMLEVLCWRCSRLSEIFKVVQLKTQNSIVLKSTHSSQRLGATDIAKYR